MENQKDLIKLYSTKILGLASDMPHVGRLPNPNASATRRSSLCGSKVTVDIIFKNGKIINFAQDVKACALGQAAATIFGRQIIGLNFSQIKTVRDELQKMLKFAGPVPKPPFTEFEILTPAVDYENRHDSIMLVLEATADACEIAASTVA
jgi:NifU-like protein involved in Fe-S cluster formation